MNGELVFTVDGSTALPAKPITLAEAGLKERNDLQEWVLAHPQILGATVMIIAFEFDKWRSSSGEKERDRLDVLGLDADGRLVVAELKRDRAPDTVEMQAIKYAAMTSRFTEETVLQHYLQFRQQTEPTLDEDTARGELLTHAGELDPEQLRRPRIVLVAGAFPPIVTSAAVWLTEMGLDLTLQRVQAYRVFEDQTVVTVSQLFPVPDVETFTISPQRAQAHAAEEHKKAGREQSTVLRLIATGAIPDGTPLLLRPTTEVTPEVRTEIEAWVDADPKRGRAIWRNTRRGTLEWEYDGKRYRPTEIVRRIIAEVAGLERSVRGPSWWILEDGRDLPTVAGFAAKSSFDWAPLHAALELIPAGQWTTYGDLAALVGTAAQPLGQHVATCTGCPNAWRVLGADGRPSAGFAWSDPDDPRTQQEALEQEGVSFVAGMADAASRLDADDLAQLPN